MKPIKAGYYWATGSEELTSHYGRDIIWLLLDANDPEESCVQTRDGEVWGAWQFSTYSELIEEGRKCGQSLACVCRHCQRLYKSKSGRGLCRVCWGDFSIRNHYPVKAEFPKTKFGDKEAAHL